MKKILFPLFLLVLLASCSKDDLPDPTEPTKPTVEDRKQSFHCSIHNLTYRFPEYVQDQYKTLKMPCPQCNADSAALFLTNNSLKQWEILCPIDSTWTIFQKEYLAVKTARWFPAYTYQDVMRYKIESIDAIKSYNSQTIFTNYFHDYFCKVCLFKVLDSAITQKTDSINTWHNTINGIVGFSFSTYPTKTGLPPDRRARAQQVLDSIEAIMPSLNVDYKKEYNSINQFVGTFNYARQQYLYCKKTGTTQGSYSTRDIVRSKICADAYISDTVVINIGGGPDYKTNGTGTIVDLFKPKDSNYSVQNNSSKMPGKGTANLSHGITLKQTKTRKSRTTGETQYQFSTYFTPSNIDLMPAQYLPRKYNTYTTSEFVIYHPQKGNQLYANGTMYTWNFIDLAKKIGGYDKKYPYNMVPVYYAELLSDVGVLEIRKVVEWCKARGKKMVIMGSSWGGAMIFDYIRYYGTSDFDQVIIADQNPNMQASIVEAEMEDYVYGGEALKFGTDPSYKEVNLNNCVIATDVYRRMEWLAGKNLSNVTFYCATTDTNVGMIPASDIATLKSLGAKVYVFPAPITHGVFHDYRAWYRYITPTLQ